MSPLLALFPGLLALLMASVGLWRARRALKQVWEALNPLLSEQTRIETRRFELENELDVRIKRLLARETYWRGMATAQPQTAETVARADVIDDGESTLALKRRIKGA